MGYGIWNEATPLKVGPGATKSVLMSLARHADDTTRKTYPGLALIADEVGKSVDTVRRAVRLLEYLGVLQRRTLPTGRGNRLQWTVTPVETWPTVEDVTLALKDRQQARGSGGADVTKRVNEHILAGMPGFGPDAVVIAVETVETVDDMREGYRHDEPADYLRPMQI